MAIPFLRPSKEKSRRKLINLLSSAVCEIRIVNPIAQEVAERLAELFIELIEANELEVEKMNAVISQLEEGF